MSQVEISFVLPAYNEETLIEATISSIDSVIQHKRMPYEIVVVDDGSIDNTFKNAMRSANSNGHVKVLSYPKNEGKGHAIKTGFLESNGNIVFYSDSDMEIAFENVLEYVEALKSGDIVIASKRHPLSHVEAPLSRRLFSHCFNLLVRFLTGVPLKDTQSGLKAMRKDAFMDIVPKLAVKRFAFDVELLAVANLYGLKVVEMPVTIKLGAKFKPKEMWRMFLDLLGISYRLRVIHWYQKQARHSSCDGSQIIDVL